MSAPTPEGVRGMGSKIGAGFPLIMSGPYSNLIEVRRTIPSYFKSIF